MAACSKYDGNAPDIQPVGVIMTAEDFGYETKTSISSNLSFRWAEGDVIGVVPMDGKTLQTNYEIQDLGSDPKIAAFDGGAWALKEGEEYSAYYPCQRVPLKSNGLAQVSFIGQAQSSNDNMDHLGAYDYMYANAVAAENGNTTFAFKHKVSLVRITLPVKASSTYTNIRISCETAVFAKNATLSIADGSLVAGEMSTSMDVELDYIPLSKGDNLIVWAAVLPTAAVGGKNLYVTLSANGETDTIYDITSAINGFEAGKAYNLVGKSRGDVIFTDDFAWLSSAIESYNKTNSPNVCADFVNGFYATLADRISIGNSYSPNLHSTLGTSTFTTMLSEHKYSDMNPDVKVIYAQGTSENPYLKFCKGNTQTALALTPFSTAYDSVELSCDWAIHMTNSALDVVHLQLKIEGNGSFANGTKVSDPIASGQTKVDNPFWTNARFTINGVDTQTKILISSKEAYDDSYAANGQHRFYLDNLCITENLN